MSVKHSTHRRVPPSTLEQQRVGNTYGERRQMANASPQATQQTETTGLSQRIQQLKGHIKDFLNVTPRIDPSMFPSNARFQSGDNIEPYKGLKQLGRSYPLANDAAFFADLDQILAKLSAKK